MLDVACSYTSICLFFYYLLSKRHAHTQVTHTRRTRTRHHTRTYRRPRGDSRHARARAHAHIRDQTTQVTASQHARDPSATVPQTPRPNRHAPPLTRGLNRFRRRRLLRLGEGGTPLSVWSRNGRVGRGASLFTWAFIGGKTAESAASTEPHGRSAAWHGALGGAAARLERIA